MTYEEGILEIPKQLAFQPVIANKENLKPFSRIIICGMGGSRLAADILNMIQPELEITVHSDYGLPNFKQENLKNALVIANSYSGDTAETISAAHAAREHGLNLAVVTSGGELQKIAAEHDLPHIIVEHGEMPARLMFYQDLIALSALIGVNLDIYASSQKVDPAVLKGLGANLAQKINTSIPLIYSSTRFNELGYIWKIIFNETGQIPAFQNRLPELDHNEIAGFHNPDLAGKFICLMIQDASDQLAARVQATTEVLNRTGIEVIEVPAAQGEIADRIIASTILAHWTGLALAEQKGMNPLSSDLIQELKNKLQ